MDTPESECIRRSKGRKQDPTTSIIYSAADVPEDPKVKDRLVEVVDEAGDQKRIAHTSEVYSAKVASVKTWC